MRRQTHCLFAVGQRLQQLSYMLTEVCGRKQETSSSTEEPPFKDQDHLFEPVNEWFLWNAFGMMHINLPLRVRKLVWAKATSPKLDVECFLILISFNLSGSDRTLFW